MSKWSSRLDRLRELVGGRECASCGAGGTGPVRFRSTAWGDPEPRACGTCGAEPYRFTLRLDSPHDLPTEWPEGA